MVVLQSESLPLEELAVWALAGAGARTLELDCHLAKLRSELFQIVSMNGPADEARLLGRQLLRSGTSVALYGTAPVDDLTSIDIAPTAGYDTTAIEAVPGYGYVFQMSGGDGYARFGAIRVTHVSQQYMIFDWSYQTDPGNPELQVRGGLPVFDGIVVRPSK